MLAQSSAAATPGATPRGNTPRGHSNGRGTPHGPAHAWQTPRGEPGSTGSVLRGAAAAAIGLCQPNGPPPMNAPYRKGVDVAPDVLSAGKGDPIPRIRPDVIIPTPRTPDNITHIQKRHRRRTNAGDITTNWATRDMPKPSPGNGYGIKTQSGVNVAQSFQAGQHFGIAEYINSRGEAIYYSTVREPLGKSWSRGHQLPDETKEDAFLGFGKPTPSSYTSKECIFPRDREHVPEATLEMYKKTHGDFDPGEVVLRRYDWPAKVTENPHFRFGRSETTNQPRGGGGVKAALTMDREDDGGFLQTRIVKSTSEQYRQVVGDPLGAGRNLMQGKQQVPPGHTYGMKTGAEESAWKLIRGNYSVAEQMPDSDLGHCPIPGRRNCDTNIALGKPTVRFDKLPPGVLRSVADSTNYGDELEAFDLIYPSTHQVKGLSEEDFSAPRSCEELSELFEKAGTKLDPEDFQSLFDLAMLRGQDRDEGEIAEGEVAEGGSSQDGKATGFKGVSVALMLSLYADWEASGRPELR